MSELAEQHQAWASASRRLWFGAAPAPKPPRPRPVSPFVAVKERRKHKLFLRAIEEIDEYGNIVVHELFTPPWKRIACEVAAKHQVSMTDLFSARRDQMVVRARHEIFWRCRYETTMSLPQIGKRFGDRDHTTVLHGIRKHTQRMEKGSL